MRARGIEISTSGTPDFRGATLLWGHALMGSMRQEEAAGIMPWAGLPAELRVVRWDTRGHGRSEASLSNEDYRWSELARDLWAIADGLNVDRAFVGGVSMGAGTALHAAMLDRERTRGLVLMAPPTAWKTRPRQARLYRSTARMVGHLGTGPIRSLGQLTGWSKRGSPAGRLQTSVTKGLRRADARAVQAALHGAALSDLPTVEALAALDVPTLILAWPGDRSHPLSVAETLATSLPDARLHVAHAARDVDSWPEVLRSFLRSVAPEAHPAGSSRTHHSGP